ncbi:site-2 protease family protein [Candidatus Uhrbacteria bacterium]|nr:site-2 protease family protein [Candidatus Uhrbacteria bacterium]
MLALLFENPVLFVVVLLAIIVALTVHEFSHALVGYKLGDSTAMRLGRLTLNPMAHIDWYGLLLLVLVGFGWGKPVPFNPHNLKWQKWGPVWVALAGPLSNLVLAILFAVVANVLVMWTDIGSANALLVFLTFGVVINLALCLFNLIPIPPLDGSKLLFLLLDKPQYTELRFRLETQGTWLLIGIILFDAILNVGLFSKFFGVVQWLAVNVFLSGFTTIL